MSNNKDMDALGALLGLGIMGAMLNSDGKGMPNFTESMMKGNKPENPFKIDPVDMAKKSASTAKQLYDAYVEVGFTQEQAFELVKGILTTKKN